MSTVRGRLYPAQREALEKSIEHLQNTFDWKDTPEGFAFWQSVVDKLEAVLEEDGKKEPSPFEKAMFFPSHQYMRKHDGNI